MDLDELKRKVDEIWWWHSIDLGNGLVTPGHSHNEEQLDYLQIPDSLVGKTVLDIGAWDGYFSFLAEERGATVTATDDVEYSWGMVGMGKAGFDLAKSVRRSGVREYSCSVYNLSSEEIGQFDIVFLFGVLYHLKNPYAVLERVYELTKEMAIVETASLGNDIDRPLLTFYRVLPSGDNYFAPNVVGLVRMLLSVGFARVEPTLDYPEVPNEIRVAVHAWR